ncbi:hypothetical protein [Streptomyces sp. NPDC097619]|uniref:hypothetical protein n=1 Tax=Streptomyces sp. NPDC097619 TaxID=3157228 RepID=UPI003320C7BE
MTEAFPPPPPPAPHPEGPDGPRRGADPAAERPVDGPADPAADPFAAPAADPGEPDPAAGPTLVEELRDGAAVTLLVAFSGVFLGLLWAWLAPRVQYVSNGEAVFLRDTENEGRIGADGTFFLIALGLGVLSGVLVFLARRRRGAVGVVIGLSIGSVLASLLGWRLGLWLGPSRDVVDTARAVGKGVPFDAPLQLLAYGVLLVWPVSAVAAHLGMTMAFGPRDPEPKTWETYPPGYAHPRWNPEPTPEPGEGTDAPAPPRDPFAPPG